MIIFEPVRRVLAERFPLGAPAADSTARSAMSARLALRRCGALGTAMVLTPLAGYLGIAVLVAIVIGTAEAASFSSSAALAAALPGWLALHQVPLSISGAPLSAFPMAPTGLVVLLIAAASSRAADRAELTRPDQARWVVLSMALAHGLIGVLVAFHLPGPVAADPVRAFLYCGLTALVAATLGVAGRCGLLRLVRAQAGAEICAGARIGASAVTGAVVTGALLVLSSLLFSLPEIGDILGAAGSAGDAFGLTLLSLMYLPNAVLAAWSFAAGSGLSIGAVELSPFGMTTGGLPAVPLFAALPSGSGAWWWVLVLALPPLLGVWMGRRCLRVPVGSRRTWWVFAVAVGLATPGLGLLAGLAGGSLGGAVFDPVTLEPGLLAAATFGWLALPASAVVWWGSRREDRHGVQGVSPGEPPDTAEREMVAHDVDTASETEEEPAETEVPEGEGAGDVGAEDESAEAEVPGDVGADDAGADDAGADDTGADDTGADDTGADDTGADDVDAEKADAEDEPAHDFDGGGTDQGDGEDPAGASGEVDGQSGSTGEGTDSVRPW